MRCATSIAAIVTVGLLLAVTQVAAAGAPPTTAVVQQTRATMFHAAAALRDQKKNDVFRKVRAIRAIQREFSALAEATATTGTATTAPSCSSDEYKAELTKLFENCQETFEGFEKAKTEEEQIKLMSTLCEGKCGAYLKSMPSKPVMVACQREFTQIGDMCLNHPRCMSSDFFAKATAMKCLEKDPGVKAFFELQAGADAAKVCEGECLANFKALAAYSECVDKKMFAAVAMIDVMCLTVDGERCYSTLRQMQTLDCQRLSSTKCGWTNMSCTYTANNQCETKTTVAALTKVCTPCLAKFIGAMRLADPTEGADMTIMTSLFCMKDTDKFCYPTVQPLFMTKGLFDAKNVDITTERKSAIDAVCPTVFGRRCARRSFIKMQRGAIRRAISSIKSCMSSYGSKTEAEVKAYCKYSLAKLERIAKETAIGFSQFRLFCAKDNADAYCLPKVAAVVSKTACHTEGKTACPSSSSCTSFLSDAEALGCCAKAFTDSMLYKAIMPRLPPTKTSTSATSDLTPANLENRPADAWTTGNYWKVLQVCSTVNTDAFKTKMTEVCTSQKRTKKPVAKKLKLKVVWSIIKDNKPLKLRLETALASDAASGVGVSEEYILEPALTEDAGARRAEETTTVFNFKIDGANDAEASEGSDAYDEQIAAGTFDMSGASEVTSSKDCEGCISRKEGSTGSGTDDLMGTSTQTTFAPSASAAVSIAAAAVAIVLAVVA